MKLQFRYHEDTSFKVTIKLYHNGSLAKSYKIWADDFDAEIGSLMSKGYTYGYTPEEVAEAKEWYENRLNNVIKEDELMDQYTMTEQAYKNGYNAALKDFVEALEEHVCSYDLDNYHWFEAVDVKEINDIVESLIKK